MNLRVSGHDLCVLCAVLLTRPASAHLALPNTFSFTQYLQTIAQPAQGIKKVTACCWSLNGKRLAVVTTDRVVHLFGMSMGVGEISVSSALGAASVGCETPHTMTAK